MSALLRRLWHEQCGEDDTEYALLIALIALVLVTVLVHVGKAIQQSVDSTPAVIASGGAGSGSGSGAGGGSAGSSQTGNGGSSGSNGNSSSGSGSGGGSGSGAGSGQINNPATGLGSKSN